MFRLVIARALTIALVLCVLLSATLNSVFAQQPPAAAAAVKTNKTQKNWSPEQIAEITIIVYGTRPILSQIRRNGIERGRITRFTTDGRSEESTYERRFVRGESLDKDKIRLDQKAPTLEYALIYGGGRLWGIINGAAFTPRQDAAALFMSTHRHSIDTLLRYKENGATLKLLDRINQKGLDLYIIELTDKENKSTRYYISARSHHVMWLDWEDSANSSSPVKYRRTFHDYRYAQSTLVPYRSVLLEDGKQTQETRVMNITYGAKVDDNLFKSPDS